MIRRLLRSHCESFALVVSHRVAAGDVRIPVTATRAAALLESLLPDPFYASALRSIVAELEPWDARGEDRQVLARVVAAIVAGRLVLVRGTPPPLLRGYEGTRPPADPSAEDDISRSPPPVDATHWVEIYLVDGDNEGIPGQRYLVISADGRQYRGYTDSLGSARITRLPPGTCQVSFPDLDAGACQQVASRDGAP
ncbi:MAG: hypothetical protein H0T76_20950 [Nannocystis sp.]|nr:hypothetical protein [Nannocystis sp.]MBA3548958.1 hypothetical protein [Nannocystis sp.]